MADLFFYGTLRHLPLLGVVLGRDAGTLQAAEAQLGDHAVHWVQDQPFPILVVRPGAVAKGLLVRGLTEADLARLDFYEGGFDYALRELSVTLADDSEVAAQLFYPPADGLKVGGSWALAEWVATWGNTSLEAAREVMSWFGRKSSSDIAVDFPAIRRRAWARVMAREAAPDPERDISRDVAVHARRAPYAQFFAVDEVDLSTRRHAGDMGPVVGRAALVVGQAAVVLPYDPVRDRVLLIEQFRAPVFLAGDPAPWVWEPIAGLIDPGEDAATAARREAMEEARLVLDRLEPAGQVYSSTGSSTEFLHLFIGLSDLPDGVATVGGADEGEDIRGMLVSFDALMKNVDAGLYRDMPLVTTALWLARHRDRLRKAAREENVGIG